MKKLLLILSLMCMIAMSACAVGGTYTTNGYFYLPAYGAYGTDEFDEYNAYMQIADTQIEANKTASLYTKYSKYDATSAPGVTNDVDEGYLVGSHWLDITNDKEYVCLDNTDGAAVWTETTGAASGATTYLELTDTPGAYDTGKYAKSTAAGVIWDTPSGAGDMLKLVYDTNIDGDIDVSAGGTAKSSWTQYAIPYVTTTTAFGEIPIGTAEYALTVNVGANGYDWTLFDLSLYYLKTEIDTQGEVETIWGTALVNDGDLNSYYLKTAIDTLTEVEAIYSKDITDSTELASALTDYYLKTAIDTQGEMETIWTVTLATDTEVAALTFPDLDDTPGAYDTGKYAKSTAAGVIWDTPSGAGDMLKATYDADSDDEVDVAGGGTEKASWTQYCIPYLSGATAFGEIPIGTDNYALTVNGATGYDWTNLQVYDAALTSISGLTYASPSYIKLTANDTYAVRTIAEVKTDLDLDLSLYYLKTEIDAQSEVETIWGVTLATDTEVAALTFPDLADTPVGYDNGKYAKSTAAGVIWDSPSVADKLNWAYPQDYATGTGTVGDPWAGSCIEDAYAAASAGDTIYLRAGYYQLSGNLTLAKAINVIGEGMGKTFVVTVDATGLTVSADYVSIKNLTVDGNAQTDNTQYLCPIKLTGSYDYTLLENIEVKNAGYYGLSINEANHSLFQNIYAHDNYRHGLHPGSDTVGRNKYNTYRDIYAWNNGADGFDDSGDSVDQNEKTYNVYDGIHSWDNGVYGIYIAYQRNVTITNCSATGNTHRGFDIFKVDDSSMNNCFTDLSGRDGIRLYGCENFNISNLISKNNNVNESVYVGILISGVSNNIKFTLCQSYDDRTPKLQKYGLWTADTADNIQLVECDLSGNLTGNIDNDASATITALKGVLDGDTPVAGDIQYHNGTNWVRLAKGSAGQVLTMNAGATAPEWQTP